MSKNNLVFITGFLCDSRIFKAQSLGLSHKVNTHIVEAINFNSLEEIIIHINSTVKEPFILGGHSLGAWVAIEYLKQHQYNVKKLLLMSSSAGEDDKQYERKRLEIIKQARQGNVEHFLETLAKSFIYNESIYPDVLEMFKQNKASMEKQQTMLLNRQNRLPFLKEISQSVLVLVGEYDDVFYDDTLLIARTIKNATLQIIQDAGHMITMESPDEVTHVILDWI